MRSCRIGFLIHAYKVDGPWWVVGCDGLVEHVPRQSVKARGGVCPHAVTEDVAFGRPGAEDAAWFP